MLYLGAIEVSPIITSSKTGQILDGTVVSLSASDLQGATSIKQYGLRYCNNLQSVEIPNTIITIEQGAFYQDRALTTVTFEAGSQLTTIGNDAFRQCENLDLIIPDTVTSIGQYAFYACKLKSIKIPAGITSLSQYTFYNCTKVEEIIFAEGSQLTKIGTYAFSGVGSRANTPFNIDLSPCTNLTTISSNAFDNVKAKNIILPVNVTKIESYALPYSWLETLTVLAPTPPTLNSQNTFNVLTAVYIPKGTLSAYESATNWSAFTGKFVELEA